MTLSEIAAQSGVGSKQIIAFTQAGLLPCKDETSAYSDKDLYWLDMVNCFVENGSSLEDLKTLLPLCESKMEA